MSAIKSRYGIMVVVLATTLLGACASVHAPEGWLPRRDQVAADPYGGWMYLELGTSEYPPIVQGEYIGVDDSAAYVLSVEGMVRVPFTDIFKAQLRMHEINSAAIGAWGALGTLSTLTHGYWLGLSAPLWIGVWVGSANAESRSGLASIERVDSDDKIIPASVVGLWCRSNAIYARFPQGIPEGIDRTRLRGKSSLPGFK